MALMRNCQTVAVLLQLRGVLFSYSERVSEGTNSLLVTGIELAAGIDSSINCDLY